MRCLTIRRIPSAGFKTISPDARASGAVGSATEKWNFLNAHDLTEIEKNECVSKLLWNGILFVQIYNNFIPEQLSLLASRIFDLIKIYFNSINFNYL